MEKKNLGFSKVRKGATISPQDGNHHEGEAAAATAAALAARLAALAAVDRLAAATVSGLIAVTHCQESSGRKKNAPQEKKRSQR